MKNLIIIFFTAIILSGCASERRQDVLQIHQGLYAFCGASGAISTGKTVIVEGMEFKEGCSICPVLRML